MWLLPDQARAIVEGCGLRAAAVAAQTEHALALRIDPPAGAIRLELQPATRARSYSAAAGVELDLRPGQCEGQARDLLASVGLGRWLPSAAASVARLLDAFREYELLRLDVGVPAAGLAEFTSARALCDDNAAFRNERVAELLRAAQPEAARRLKSHGIDYVRLDGSVGLISVGAGETMAAMDLLDAAGARAACFLDISGGFGVEALTAAFRQVAALPGLRAVLVNVFGGLTRVDRVAESLLAALDALGDLGAPLVIRLEGTEAARGRELIDGRGLRCEPTLRGAIAAAVKLATGGCA